MLCLMIFFKKKTKAHIRCAIRSIAQRKHVGIVMTSLHTTEIVFICLHPLGGLIFPLCSFLSFHLKPASLCKSGQAV